MPLCFAYGSNMDRDQMAARCPGSRPIGLARLARHRPAIMREGWLTVIRDPRCDVHGLLWDVPLADMSALDRYEGVSGGLYAKAHLAVLTAAGARRALVYLGANAGPGRPRPGYLEAVLGAARALGLPPAYLAGLASMGPAGRPLPAPAPSRRPAVQPVGVSPAGAALGPAERTGRWSPD